MSFLLDSQRRQGSVFGEKFVRQTKNDGKKKGKKNLVMFFRLRCGAVNMRVLQLTAITPPGLANATP